MKTGNFVSDSRWVLYHGTSTLRLKNMLAENRLRIAPCGDRWVSLTTERSVAVDRDCGPPIAASEPVVLLIDGEGLLKLNYDLQAVNPDDPVLSWENEIGCTEDIAPLNKVLIGAQPLSPVPLVDENVQGPFKPSRIPSAYLALQVMSDLTRKLVAEEITSERAEAVVRSLDKLIDQLRAC